MCCLVLLSLLRVLVELGHVLFFFGLFIPQVVELLLLLSLSFFWFLLLLFIVLPYHLYVSLFPLFH